MIDDKKKLIMENLEEILKELKLNTYLGTYNRNNSYIIDLDSDNDWGKVFTILDNSPLLYQKDENTLLTQHNSSLIYEYEDTDIIFNLKADFDNDQYSLVISEI